MKIQKKGNKMIKCSECKHIMYSDCYGECKKGIKSIVNADDGCEYGEKRIVKNSEKEYGCVVCVDYEKCGDNTFGICNKYRRKV